MGMTWWNGCSLIERSWLMKQAREIVGQMPSVAEVWTLWKAGKVRMGG